MLERNFGIAEKTAKRDLSDVSRAGLIAFIRRGARRAPPVERFCVKDQRIRSTR